MMAEMEKSKEQLLEEIAMLREQLNNEQENFIDYKNSVTEKIQKVEHEAKLSRQSNNILLANMSHDIRVPMNGIMGMIEVLQRTNLDEEQYEYLDIINNSANILLNIIDNILDFSKLTTGDIRIQENDFQLNREIDSIFSLQSMRAHGKGIELSCNISPELPQNLIGDSNRMKQILNNLTSNAIKFTKEGTVKIDIDKDWENKEAIRLKFTITDTGIGMKEDVISVIKEAYENNDYLESFSNGKIGIGLAIVGSLSKILGGGMGFNSKEGEGTTFWFTIEFKKASYIKQDITPNELDHSIEESDILNGKSKLRILLVEDNVLNQKFATATLKKRGHTVEIAENGKIALQKIKENIFDLVLMDVQMPVMDGVEATIEIRERERRENLKHLNIIAVTAYAMDKDKEKCLNAGMDLFLAKPFKPDDLIQLVENLELK
jgi:signal transduction histidine kinase/ActR/RegA family two-component response regulator